MTLIASSADSQRKTSGKLNVAFINLPVNWKMIEQLQSSPDSAIKHEDDPYGLPLGLLYLSSYVKKHSAQVGEVGMIDFQTELRNAGQYLNLDDFITKSALKNLSFTPDILAFSIMFSPSHYFLLKSAEVLRSLWPGATNICGGIHATNTTEFILKNPGIDYVLRGEGEYSFALFLDTFYQKEERDKIKGLYNKEKIQLSPPNEIADYMPKLDAIPFPDWNLVKMDCYIQEAIRMRRVEFENEESIEKKAAIMMTSRGCPYHCTFCSSYTVHGRKVRERSAENVIAEMTELHNSHGINCFIFEDDMFVFNHKRAKKLLEDIIEFKKDIPGFEVHFPNALAVNVLSDEIMRLLVEAGMRITIIAIESGSPYVQKHIIKKNVNLENGMHVIKYLRSLGVIVRTSFIMGFPHETKEMMQETIKYCKNLNADWCNINIAQPLVGTRMYEEFEEMGVLTDELASWAGKGDTALPLNFRKKKFMGDRLFDTPEISKEELLEINYRANLEINFINNVNLKEANFQAAEKIFEDIVCAYDFHIIGWQSLKKAKEGLGKTAEASFIHEKIINLIKTDERSLAMLQSYSDLLPEYCKASGIPY